MKTPTQLLDEFVQAGGRIAWKDGKAVMSGSIPDALIMEIREQRQAFLDAWDKYRATVAASRGWNTCPTEGEVLARRRKPPRWPARDYTTMDRWARRQSGEVSRWVLLRAATYAADCPEWSPRDRIQSAIEDLWEWQRMGTSEQGLRPGEIIQAFDECVETKA